MLADRDERVELGSERGGEEMGIEMRGYLKHGDEECARDDDREGGIAV